MKLNSLITNLTINKITNYKAGKKITNCSMDDLQNLLNKKAPNVIQTIDNEKFTKKPNPIIETIKYPFVEMPKDMLNFVADKTNFTPLKESKILVDYNAQKQQKAYERAMRGLFQNSDKFIEEYAKSHNISLSEIEKFVKNNSCSPEFKEICDEITKNFYKLFDENLAIDKAHYNTPHERTIVKIVIGIVAATMLSFDYHNKSILNGKTEEEANKSARAKQKQELIESAQEALSQYLLLGAFSDFTNNSPMAAPILTTALSLVFRITSRLSTKRPIRRIKLDDKEPEINRFIGFNNYYNSLKNQQAIEAEKITVSNNKDNKKHILSPKNIFLACLGSIVVGFSGKGIRNTKTFNTLKDSFLKLNPIKTAAEKYNKLTIGKVWLNEKEIGEFIDNTMGKNNKFKNMKNQYWNITKKQEKSSGILYEAFHNPKLVKDGKILLGEYEKMLTVPLLNVKVSIKKLLDIPLVPFKLVKELASYPYKAAHKICEGFGIVKKVPEKKLKNDYNLLNTYLDYQDKLKKNGGVADKEFIKNFQQHLEDNRISALNKETQSAIDNAAVGKTTQLLGTAASLYFNMNDDYNETAKQTGDKQKAQKDARLRGVNKIVRIVTQISMMDIFNKTFKVSYAKSLIGAGVITAACTVATDSISRILSGMPFRKMNKEELEQYQKRKDEGFLKQYYSAIDKITD